MDTFRSDDEQVEALRRWWDENGRSTVAAIVIALGLAFGWQGWQTYQENRAIAASEHYQTMLRGLSGGPASEQPVTELAQQLKSEYGGTTYARFAALHLAAMAVERGDLADARDQLRWVLGKAPRRSDVAQVAQLRLARVLAAQGDSEQALAILAEGGEEAYRAAYAMATGDVLLAAGRTEEARDAYINAQALLGGGQLGVNLDSLQIKLQSLSPQPPRAVDGGAGTSGARSGETPQPSSPDGAATGAGD
ncbi:MAG: tetratricopeptide repeat protein [Halioglobus sp.]|nr:tetratricopeptide repeat protein [Halioglobus sp.]